MKGLTQAFHLSKKQLKIPMKIHTKKKEKKEIFGGKGNMSQRRLRIFSVLLPRSMDFSICL